MYTIKKMSYTQKKDIENYNDSPDKDSFLIAGVSFHKSICEKLKINDILDCVADPDNEFGSNAIKILNENNELCGYVPKNYIEKVNDKSVTKLKIIHVKYHMGNYGVRVLPDFDKV